MKVADVISGQHLVTARVDQQLGDVAELMKNNRVTGVPIVDEWGAFVGLVTVATLLEHARETKLTVELPLDSDWSPAQHVVAPSVPWQSLSIREVLVTDIRTIDVDADLLMAARVMLDHGVHRVVVLGSDRNVCGVLSALDFVRLFAEGKR